MPTMPILTILASGEPRWRAIWRDADGTQGTATFKTEQEAKAHEFQKKLARAHVCELDGCEELVIRRGQKFCRPEHKAKFNNDKRAGQPRTNRPAAALRAAVICKLEECGELVEQNPTGRPSEFCKGTNHGQFYWNRQAAEAKGPNVRHRVTNVDPSTRTGDCSICGPGVIVWLSTDKHKDGRERLRARCSNRTEAGRAKAAKNYARSRAAFLAKVLYAHGITESEWDTLVLAQEGRCAACGKELVKPQVDHDPEAIGHFVRGLLCVTCNTGIGKLGDTIEGLEGRLLYLRAAEARRVNPMHGAPLTR